MVGHDAPNALEPNYRELIDKVEESKLTLRQYLLIEYLVATWIQRECRCDIYPDPTMYCARCSKMREIKHCFPGIYSDVLEKMYGPRPW